MENKCIDDRLPYYNIYLSKTLPIMISKMHVIRNSKFIKFRISIDNRIVGMYHIQI